MVVYNPHTWLPYYDEPSEGRYLLHLGGSYSYRDADTDLGAIRLDSLKSQ